jgi:23S rRNA pseudouridine2605 synthase
MRLRREDLSSADGTRLHVYLARCGIASRRACEGIIKSGRVAVNGAVITAMGYKLRDNDRVTLDGSAVFPEKRKVYIALNKPPAYLCAAVDERGRALARDLFKDQIPERLFHVGRLDYMSSGLIFFTNDGIFAKIISHPRYEIEKEYFISCTEAVPDELLLKYRQGVRVEGVTYRALKYRRLADKRVELTLAQGKNREIRTVFGAFGVEIKTLRRIRIGTVTLAGLASGRFRFLTKSEVRWFLTRSPRPNTGRADGGP